MSALTLDDKGVLVSCPSCDRTNRLGYRGLGKPTRCGNCKTILTAPGQPIEAPTASAFQAVLQNASLPIVVDFWAPWCGPCRMVAPELEKVARTAAGEFLVVKVNTEALPEVGDQFRIRSIPTMAVFRDGREVTRSAGARPAADILALVRQALVSVGPNVSSGNH
jgi:thioredoxin 2